MSKKFDFLYERKKKPQYLPLQLELELPLLNPDIDGFKVIIEKKPEEERGVLIIPL